MNNWLTNHCTKEERAEMIVAHGNVCDQCGNTNRRLELHHTDYSTKPTMVLCPSCHKFLHSAMKSAGVNIWGANDTLEWAKQYIAEEVSTAARLAKRASDRQVAFLPAPAGKAKQAAK